MTKKLEVTRGIRVPDGRVYLMGGVFVNPTLGI